MTSSLMKTFSTNSIYQQPSNSIRTSEYQNQLNHFPKALSTNDDSLFKYIKYLVYGSSKDQKNYNQYIFSHLKNTIDHEFNTLTLRNTCKFIMTLILLENFHIYENIVKYLIPSITNKINDQVSKRQGKRTNQIKPVWQLDQFCIETIYVLANWLPDDFYDPSKPSIFSKIKDKYKLEIVDFKYFNIDKIVFCYRIIKDLGINDLQHKCDRCESKGGDKKANNNCKSFKKKFKERSAIQSALFKESKRTKRKDLAWQTGFQPLQALQQVPQQISSSSLVSKTNQEIKIESKHQWNPQNCEILNIKQLKQKQQRLNKKMIQVRSKVRQVQQGIYHIQQKKLIQNYLKKNKIELNVDAKIVQENGQKDLEIKRKKLISVRSMKQFSSYGLIPTMEKLPLLSPRQKKKKQISSLLNNTQKSEDQSSYLQIFQNYLQNKSQSFIKKFKLAIICSKATIQLKKYHIDESTLKCKTFVKNNFLKVKFFKDIGPIKMQLIDPKRCLHTFEQGENEVKMVFKYEISQNCPIKFDPILIKVDSQQIYAPIGCWHLVRASSKFISCFFENNFNQSKKSQSQNKYFNACYQKCFQLNRQIFRTLKDLNQVLLNQFTQLKSQNRHDEQENIQQRQIVTIKLHGEIMNCDFFIEITKIDFVQSEQQNFITRGFYKKSSNHNDILTNQQKLQRQAYIISALAQQLIFILSKNQYKN